MRGNNIGVGRLVYLRRMPYLRGLATEPAGLPISRS